MVEQLAQEGWTQLDGIKLNGKMKAHATPLSFPLDGLQQFRLSPTSVLSIEVLQSSSCIKRWCSRDYTLVPDAVCDRRAGF